MTTCTACQKQFTIYPEDRVFYKKFDVPDPAQCPTCRSMERLIWRNERTLHAGICGLCQKKIVTVYPPTSSFPIYCHACYFGDGWDARSFARPYDFSKGFFEQYADLLARVPRQSLNILDAENCEYGNYVTKAKDCYLAFATTGSEKIYYSEFVTGCKEVLDCGFIYDSEMSVECVDGNQLFRVYAGQDVDQCMDCAYLFNSKNCTNCYLCAGLHNKQYYFENKPCAKDEYERKAREAKTWPEDERRRRFEAVKLTAIRRYAHLQRNENTTGDYLYVCKDAFQCFDGVISENVRYCTNLKPHSKDSIDCGYLGLGSELLMNEMSCIGYHNLTGVAVWHSSNAYYSTFCSNVENTFGSSGLRFAKYCILNQPYAPEEYAAQTAKIVEAMKFRGEWGKFFPPALSSFAYNETVAIDFYPIVRDEALRRGYRWNDDLGKKPVNPDLPICAICGQNFSTIKQAVALYEKLGVPQPRICPNCRFRARMKLRNPRMLWHRQCMCNIANHAPHASGARCPNEFESTYAPERPERVFCEPCYQNEVF